jgi:hypothetical protein
MVVVLQSGQHYRMASELWKDGTETDELLISAFGEETVCSTRRFEVGSYTPEEVVLIPDEIRRVIVKGLVWLL